MEPERIRDLQFALDQINKIIKQLEGATVLNVGCKLSHSYDTYSFKRFPVIMPVHKNKILNILKAEAEAKRKAIKARLERQIKDL